MSGTQSGNKTSEYAKALIIALAFLVFPLLVTSAFFAASNLKVSPLSYHYGETALNVSQPFQAPRSSQSHGGNNFLPSFMNFKFPLLPTVNLADVLLVVALVVILAILLRLRLHSLGIKRVRPFEEVEFQKERLEVASILDEAVARLNSGSDYRKTVLECYKLISQALEKKSELDGKTLTAREFRMKVSEIMSFDSPYLSKATDLFELARYSQEEITMDEALAASDCLSKLSILLKEIALPKITANEVS